MSFILYLEIVENRKQRVKGNSEQPEVKRKDLIDKKQQKNHYTKVVHQNMDPELDWILVLWKHGAQGKKDKTY